MHFSYRRQISLSVVTSLWWAITRAQIVRVTGAHTGINSVTNEPPPRRNILDMQNDVPTWSLYIQGLAAMQAAPLSDPLSYYQFAGIHGRPFEGWNGIGSNPFQGSYSWPAYCQHDSILFPIWHRPYLALFEQILARNVRDIATRYNGSSASTYQVAAMNFRIPYWDWASDSSMPSSLTAQNLSIMTSRGQQDVKNPLYEYAIPNLGTDRFPRGQGDSYLVDFTTTRRDPGDDGVSRPERINAGLQAAGLKAMVYNLLSKVKEYGAFATVINPGTSLESIHGIIHNSVGGAKGHMSPLTYSGFDPIFYLHHANVDRLFALWQAVNPDAWIASSGQANQLGTYTVPYGEIETATTPLTPFYSSSPGGASYWTADGARNLSAWGYTYPEISYWSQTPAQLAANVTSQINKLYGSTTTTAIVYTPGTARHHRRSLPQLNEWFVRIAVSKMDLGGASFNIRLFLGDPPGDTSTWSSATTLIGTTSVLVPASMKPPSGAKAFMKYAELPITDKLSVLPELANLAPETVGPYLATRFQWRVQRVDGVEVDVSDVPSLVVEVQSQLVTLADTPEAFPTYGPAVLCLPATRNKTGGKASE